MSKLIDMTEAFTEEGIERLRAKITKKDKPVLKFNYEGSLVHYKIVKVENGKVYGKQIDMFKMTNDMKIVEDV